MRWTRELYLNLMTFRPHPRSMFVELFGPLVGLADEWLAQGATQDEINLTAFDFDYVDRVRCGGDTNARNTFPTVTISETDDELIQRDYLGRTVKLCKKTATIPLPLDFPVKTMDDWLKFKPMFVFAEDRINWSTVAAAKKARDERGALVIGGIPGAYDMPRELMGEELACLAAYDQPELLHDMLQTFSDTAYGVYSRISEKLPLDQLSVHEDFAGRSGPLVGPDFITTYFKPYYRRIWDMLASRNAQIFQQDTDGNINPVIPALLDTGLTCIYPMEPAAGMDIVALRKQYGTRLAMVGGIDKHVLRKTKADIRRELEYKMQPLMREGGAIFGLDHRIPNGTPLENYRYYVRTAREILGLPAIDGKSKGWARMAF